MQTRAGTPYYISPEVLAGNYNELCDMWSCGCILYILLCGYPPFGGDDDQEIIENVLKMKFSFDDDAWVGVSAEAKDLIKKLITRPERRLTAQEALGHKWFKKVFKNDDIDEKREIIHKEKIKSFKGFMKTAKLQQAALTAIAVNASADDIRDLKEMFQQLDVNGDGSISLDELKEGLGKKENGETLYKLLKAADTDNSG